MRRRWPVMLLMVTILLGQTVSAMVPSIRGWILGSSLMVLDLLGVIYSVRAARASTLGRVPWSLIATARMVAVVANAALILAVLRAGPPWWWLGTVAHLAMFVLLGGGVLAAAVRQFQGRARQALIAEIVVVTAAGFMIVWYVALEPIIDARNPDRAWVWLIGSRLGDLVLLAAVASVVIRGAVARFSAPITVFTVGLSAYLITDVAGSAVGPDGNPSLGSWAAGIAITLAALLQTVAAMLAATWRSAPYHARAVAPGWATHLPLAALAVGCTLMLAVTLIENQMMPWGGLVCGLILVTVAVAARQWMSLRDSHDLVILDPLTRLSNRTGLDQAIEHAAKRQDPVALLLLDLDGFKLVNDAYGHATGDIVLTEFAHRMRSVMRTGQVPARIGGDEFAVLLPGVDRVEQAVAVAERILAAVTAHPVRLADDLVVVRASIGVALAAPGEPGKELVRRADVAMYHSKRAGSHSFALYDRSMTDRRAADAALSDDLDHALDGGQLHLLYQPIVDLADGRPIAAEALLRWQHPERGPISPVQFIPIAERSGAITRIGLWVLEQALQQMHALQRHSPAAPLRHMSVNLSPRQLQEPTIVHDILAVLERTGTDHRHLVLEVTESAIVDEHSGIDALRELRRHGIRVAIDDFGTGYSSLQYLTRLPVDILKIDRSFVSEMNGTAEGSAVTEAIIRLAQVLHLTTVAEGIETCEQATELQQLGCDTGQGYLFARPLPAEQLVTLMTSSVVKA